MPITELADPYGDSRLVALYDADNPAGADHAFYQRLVDDLDARTILDVGCGTGILTVTLAGPRRTVVGVDPSGPMLDYARARSGGELVDWRLGSAEAAGTLGAQFALMSGNVAQHICGAAWPATLRAIHDALAPGGVLVFESRNPAVRAWEHWSGTTTRETADGPLTEWMELDGIDGDEVSLRVHNVFTASDEHLVSTLTLAFRSAQRLTADLAVAGLAVERIAGGFDERSADADSPLLVVTARRSA